MKPIIMIIFCFSALANDVVIQELKKENKILKKQIEANKSLIKMREQNREYIKPQAENTISKHMHNSFSKSSVKNYNVFFGIEAINWGEDINQNAPTIGFGIDFKNNLGIFASAGRILITDYPATGIESLVGIFNAGIKYNYQTSLEGFSINPLIGYTHYGVDSPDAGEDPATKEEELDQIEEIRDRSGFFGGIEFSQQFADSWAINLRADITRAGSLFLNKAF